MTVAISLLIHGEAVRFNRGKPQGENFDFKYLIGRDNKEYPYVSSQCYKRYWREALEGPLSPIKRGKGNQAYTIADPVTYIDDDLFGYMRAGTAKSKADDDENAELPDLTDKYFDADDIKDVEALRKRLVEDKSIAEFLVKSAEFADVLKSKPASDEGAREIAEAIVTGFNEAVERGDLPSESMLNELKLKKERKKFQEAGTSEQKQKAIVEFLKVVFKKELEKDEKRPTTRRTAPIRMHALVAFSGIKTAKDFQTFSRDVALTGNNSVLNPNRVGIYTAWMKTRILIESHRIGKFYIGSNMELLEQELNGQDIKAEPNPFSRYSETLKFIELDEPKKKERLSAALKALADIGNNEGPASGALHDGSLRPKAFVAGFMKCVDSPFDDIWKGSSAEGVPSLDIAALTDAIKDWDDLFATKKLYFGLPQEIREQLTEAITASLKKLGFDVVIDSPRKALLTLAQEAAL
jgi:hypothetical protein